MEYGIEFGKDRNEGRSAEDTGRTGSGSDGLSLAERKGRNDSGGKILSLRDFRGRGTENLEGAELVREELFGLNRFFEGNHYDIQAVRREYEKDPDRDFKELQPGNEADVYFLSEKDNIHVIKLVQWNAFSWRKGLNQTPLEFLVNKTTLHNYYFPATANKLVGATYRKDKDGENQFNFVFDQKYVEQLLDADGEPIKATFMEIREDMEKRGFTANPKNETSYITKDGGAMISDLHLGNVLKGTDGKLYYIDVNIRLSNRELYKELKKQFE